jgi:hypothetical protein
MEAGIGCLDTLRKSIHRRLKPAGWLHPDNGDRRARDVGAFIFSLASIGWPRKPLGMTS